MRMPGVAEVAVVARARRRGSARSAARTSGCSRGATAPDLDAVRTHLEAAGLARQKWPEDVREIDEFPRTPSGKIQKFVLRQRLREEQHRA